MKFMPDAVSRFTGTKILQVKKESPTIFFGIGIAAGAAGVVLACRATLKAQPVIDEWQEEVAEVSAASRSFDHPTVTEKDVAYVYLKGGAKVAKLYLPSAALLSVSVASLTGSHIQQRRRNAVLQAAYASLFTTLMRYRERVENELGEDKERDLYLNIDPKHQYEDEHGKPQKGPALVGAKSEYSFLFDEYSQMWRKGDGDNKDFLLIAERYFNDILKARGHVFLNEVLTHLGIDITPAGQIVGWVWQGDGDNYIDFGLYDVSSQGFMRGWERSVMLDFNVDGPILELI